MPFKRRREEKTDYKKRLKLLFSKKPRLVVRKSLKHIRVQIIEYNPKGDNTIVCATTKDLKKFGWNGSANLVSAYLLGLLIGKKVLKKKINSVVLDMGFQSRVKGSKLYAVLKGALDGGLSIPHSTEILPSEDRISGKHVLDYAQKLKKENLKKYKEQFSVSNPEKIPKMLEKVKSNILKSV